MIIWNCSWRRQVTVADLYHGPGEKANNRTALPKKERGLPYISTNYAVFTVLEVDFSQDIVRTWFKLHDELGPAPRSVDDFQTDFLTEGLFAHPPRPCLHFEMFSFTANDQGKVSGFFVKPFGDIIQFHAESGEVLYGS